MRSGSRFRKEGVVVSIRISPKDCISTLDAMEKAGIKMPGMSFPMMVSIIYTALLEEAIQRGAIPEPDMFQYGDRMNMYLGSAQTRRSAGAKALQGDAMPAGTRRDIAIRVEELKIKREYMPEAWTPQDEQEIDRLTAML